MSEPALADLFAALDATWPARSQRRVGPWTIREGAGGGSRVSAAIAEEAVAATDVARAVAAMGDLGQHPVFQVRPGQGALDALLANLGWDIADPTLILAATAAVRFAEAEAWTGWPPEAGVRATWEALGIGPERQAVMDRVAGAKAVVAAQAPGQSGAILAGLAFVAVHRNVAMVHAMGVVPAHRRCGVARRMLAAAGRWAQDRGATTLALAVTEANAAARALYSTAGFTAVTGYHYRVRGGS